MSLNQKVKIQIDVKNIGKIENTFRPISPGYCTTSYANQHNCDCKYCNYKPTKKIEHSPGYCTTGYANQHNCDCKYCI